jgi:hypothetical protein
MKLLNAFRDQVKSLGPLKRAWFTTFNLGTPFFETHVLPALLAADPPLNRMDYENMQLQLSESGIDVRVFCDMRMMEADQLKRTAVPVHGILPGWLNNFGQESLFHPKVIFLEDTRGHMVLGCGSANLSISGWGHNQEVFVFRSVSRNEQYQQIKRFFTPLAMASGIEIDDTFGIRRRFDGDDSDWQFVHSFEKTNFLQQLLADIQANRLTVWSPYFSRDLAGLLAKFSDLAGKNLKFSIVPDRVTQRYVRAEWSLAIEKLMQNGVLSFHNHPSPRSDKIEMTHAKLWLASGRKARLAVGSWNCTEPGCASYERRNIEAGILFNVTPDTQIAGQQLHLDRDDFGSEQLLEDEALKVEPYPLPFELQVCFDWECRAYEVQGLLHKETDGAHYTLRLPGVKKHIQLCWKARKRDGAWPLEPVVHEVADNEALLADHCYEIWRGGQLEFRGLVQENHTTHRRAQGYDSLKELLNDLINGVDPKISTKPRLRLGLRHDDLADEELGVLDTDTDSGLTYFRLFHAFEQLRKRLLDVKSMDQLEKLLFVYPGSVQELVGKVRAHISASDDNPVFNWFLWQEARTLYQVALQAYAQHRAKYARTVPPDNGKWASLELKEVAVSLPPRISRNAKYLQQVKAMCNYER